jgi:hypothetical protein
MPQPAQSPLERSVLRLAGVLSTKEIGRRWYETYVAALGTRAVVDTWEGGTITRVHRRAAGSEDVLPFSSIRWTRQQSGERLLEGPEIHDGRQWISIQYAGDGTVAETARDDRYKGRLVELTRAVNRSNDPFAAAVAFVVGLDEGRLGPGRVHYPVPAPGGVEGAWSQGLLGCRRALFDGRVGPSARWVVADGLEGRVVGTGATREEAVAAFMDAARRDLPRRRHTVQTITDDYDDDGNLIARGTLPTAPAGFDPVGESWRGESPEVEGVSSFTQEVDPVDGSFRAHVVFRGPKPDARPVPPKPECVPYVVLPLEPSPEDAPPAGRWMRLLGDLGVTRHVVRIEEDDGFLLVGSDLLGFVDLGRVRGEVDRLEEASDVGIPVNPEFERFVRFRARDFRWRPASAERAEGLVFAGGSSGPRFEPGSLDGDVLQAAVRRQRRVLRPVD